MTRACTLRPGRRLEAEAGALAVAWEPREGGRLVLQGESVRASLDLHVRGRLGGEAADLRQSLDLQPRLVPLEEGPERVGVRSLWTLVDADGTGYGEALQDVFVTRRGEAFLSLALRIVTRADLVVEHAAVSFALEGVDDAAADGDALVAHGGGETLLVRRPRGRGRRYDTLQWQQPHAPFYERWPPLFDQWSLDPLTFGWDRFPGAGGSVDAVSGGRAAARLAWIDGAEVPAGPQLDLRGLVWLGLGPEDEVRRADRAHEEPLTPAVQGGGLRCYDELDGAYEIAAENGDECTVDFPPDPLARPLRVRVHGLDARGGLEADGCETALLLSERGRTDDPLVWVEVPAEGRADEALLTAAASPERPTRIALRWREGLHVAYQRRDPRRRLTVHHPADLERPVAAVDLAALHLVDLRLPGRQRPALHDAPLFWMRHLPKAAAHLANRMVAWEIAESSPELVSLVLDSETPDGLVRSRYRLELPYRPDHVELRIRAELEGASAWGFPTVEYADVFPESGIDPERWEYDRIAFVGPDAVRLLETRRPYPTLAERLPFPASVLDAFPVSHSLPDAGPWRFDRTGAVVFGGSDRGTIVATAANPDPAALEHVAVLCEHWADVHFDAAAIGAEPTSSEADARGPAPADPVPDALVAELTLRVFDPASLPFDAAVEQARAELATGVEAAQSARG